MSMSHSINRGLLVVCLLAAFVMAQSSASAETLSIEYTGLNITYDGLSITEVGNPDPLTSVVLLIDGVQQGATLSSGIAIDLNIPGVSGLPVTGGTVMSAAGGSLGLTLPGGDFLNLQLGSAEVVFLSIPSMVSLQFVLAAADAEALSQSLPLDGWLGDDIAVSFSTQVKSGTLASDSGVVTGFLASGTGEISGNLVPEPATMALLLSGLLACLVGVRRRG